MAAVPPASECPGSWPPYGYQVSQPLDCTHLLVTALCLSSPHVCLSMLHVCPTSSTVLGNSRWPVRTLKKFVKRWIHADCVCIKHIFNELLFFSKPLVFWNSRFSLHHNPSIPAPLFGLYIPTLLFEFFYASFSSIFHEQFEVFTYMQSTQHATLLVIRRCWPPVIILHISDEYRGCVLKHALTEDNSHQEASLTAVHSWHTSWSNDAPFFVFSCAVVMPPLLFLRSHTILSLAVDYYPVPLRRRRPLAVMPTLKS